MAESPQSQDQPPKPKSDRRQSKLKSIVNWRPKTKTSIKSLRDLVSSSSSHNKSHHPQAEVVKPPRYDDLGRRGPSTHNVPHGDSHQLNHDDLESVEKVDSRSDAFFGRQRDPSDNDEHGSGSGSKPEPDYRNHRRHTSRDDGSPFKAESRSIPQLSKTRFDVGPLHRSPEPLIEEPSKEHSEPSINNYSDKEDSGHGISHQEDHGDEEEEVYDAEFDSEEAEINCTDEVEEEEERRLLEERMRSINERMESFQSQSRGTTQDQMNQIKNPTSQSSQDQMNRIQDQASQSSQDQIKLSRNQPSMGSQDQRNPIRNQPSTGSLNQSKLSQIQNRTKSLDEEKEPPQIQNQNRARSLVEDKELHRQQEKDKYLKREAERIKREKEEERMKLEKEHEEIRLERERERKSHQIRHEQEYDHEHEDEYDYDHPHHQIENEEEEDHQPIDEGTYSTHQEERYLHNDGESDDSEQDEIYHHETESNYHSQTEDEDQESSSIDREETREIKIKLSSPTERLKMLLDNPTNKLHQEQLANCSFKPTSLLTNKLGTDIYRKSHHSSLYPESNFSGSNIDARSPASPYPDSLFSPSGQQFDSDLCFKVSSPIEVLSRISRIEKDLEELRHLKGMDQTNLKKTSSVVIQTAYRGHIARQEYAKRLSLKRYDTTLYPPTIDNLISYGTTIPQSKQAIGSEGDSGEMESVIMLQRIIRSFLIRRRYSLVLKYGKAATQIQSTWRGYKTRHLPLPYGPPLVGIIRTLKVHRLEVLELSKQVTNMMDRLDRSISKPERLSIDTTKQTFQDDEGIAISPLQRYNPSISPIISSGSDPISPQSDRHSASPTLTPSLPSYPHRSPYLAPSDFEDDQSTPGGERSPELQLNLPRIGRIRSDTNPETPTLLPFRGGHTPNAIPSIVPSATSSDPSSHSSSTPLTTSHPVPTIISPRDTATTPSSSPHKTISPHSLPLNPPVTRSDFDEIYRMVEHLLTLLEQLVHPPPSSS